MFAETLVGKRIWGGLQYARTLESLHTAECLIDVIIQDGLMEKISDASRFSPRELKVTLAAAYGCDTASGYRQFQQGFSDGETTPDRLHVSSILAAGLVPLMIKTEECLLHPVDSDCDGGHKGHSLCTVPRASSIDFYRPLRIKCLKETAETNKKEYEDLKAEAAALTSHSFDSEYASSTIRVTVPTSTIRRFIDVSRWQGHRRHH